MTEPARQRITIILFAINLITVLGWTMISEVTGTPPTDRFLYTGFALALTLTTANTWLHRLGRIRALSRLLFRTIFIALVIWLISCPLLPLF